MANFESIAKEMAKSYKDSDITLFSSDLMLPDKNEVISVIEDIQHLFFPAYFDAVNGSWKSEEFAEKFISSIYFKLKKQIELALSFKAKSTVSDAAKEITDKFVESLPDVHKLLIKDVHANFEGDPAAQSKEEIIFSYPGFYAIFVYRIANVLYKSGVPFVPRIMTEYAHGKTGIDINPGATIGEYFFIDHG
ncbi:MAG: serine acetyltransferase, partial [Clostridia bacterium]|nr:serine acetyltransferase [Clostridia bacterium]